MRIEWDSPVLRVLRVRAWNHDLMLRPVHVFVLNPQHLALTTARLQRADDSVVHRSSDVLVLGTSERLLLSGSPQSAGDVWIFTVPPPTK